MEDHISQFKTTIDLLTKENHRYKSNNAELLAIINQLEGQIQASHDIQFQTEKDLESQQLALQESQQRNSKTAAELEASRRRLEE